MPDGSGSVYVGPGEGSTLENPVGGAVTFKVRGEQTGGVFTVFETEVAAKAGPPLHVHANEDEILYPLDGEFRFRIEDEVRDAAAGACLFVPRGVRHCFQNAGERPARMLIVFSPAGMEQFFERFAAQVAEGADEGAFRTSAAAVGMDVVGPPLAESHPA